MLQSTNGKLRETIIGEDKKEKEGRGVVEDETQEGGGGGGREAIYVSIMCSDVHVSISEYLFL